MRTGRSTSAPIDRHGDNELLVEPVVKPGGAELRLDSDGRSRYAKPKSACTSRAGRGLDLNVSYVRSQARADTNAFTNFFDSVQWPVVGENAYAPARADVPHRMLLRGRALPTPTGCWWRCSTGERVCRTRSSMTALDFVGRADRRSVSPYVRAELGVEHRFRIKQFRPWIGVRVDNAFNAFLPADVQANVAHRRSERSTTPNIVSSASKCDSSDSVTGLPIQR